MIHPKNLSRHFVGKLAAVDLTTGRKAIAKSGAVPPTWKACGLILVVVLEVFSSPLLAEEKLATPKPLLVPNKTGELLYKDDFDKDLSHWVVEQTPGGKTKLIDGKLDIDDAAGPTDKGGCTVWFKEKLSGRVLIEYDATMIEQGGPNDRISDLNCFWMAIDPKHPEDLFVESKERGGAFKKYDGLRLYYVGYGANENATTRFRRYPGDGTRPLDKEKGDLRDAKFMNVGNKTAKIQLIADGERIQFLRDGEIVFDMTDKAPFREGWFGLRTTRSHMKIDNFRVYRLASRP